MPERSARNSIFSSPPLRENTDEESPVFHAACGPFIGALLDSDSVLYNPKVSGGLRLVDVAPGVSHVQGGSHNSLIVEMDNFLVVFDAPVEMQSKWTTDAASKKYPGKPFKYLVLTHHHMDHTNGVRSYAAAGGHGSTGSFVELMKVPAN